MKRILITTNQFCEIKGSELVALELVEHFLSLGWHVDLYTNLYLPPIATEVSKLDGQDRLRIEEDPYAGYDYSYDLIWIQHSVLPPPIIHMFQDGISSTVVWHHMSSHVPLELPILSDIESRLADLSTVVSGEVREVVKSFNIEESQIRVFDNPSPDRFGDAESARRPPALRRLLIVSNHPPNEVLAARNHLRDEGIVVEMLGDRSRVERVGPDALVGFDAVLTIGKTVQYSLSMGIPCYIYDHFGGEGWLTPETFDREAFYNFSGRSTKRFVGGDLIADELLGGYVDAAQFVRDNRSKFINRWRLSTQIDTLLQSPEMRSASTKQLSDAQCRRLAAFNALHREMYRALEYHKLDLARHNDDLALHRKELARHSAESSRRRDELIRLEDELIRHREERSRLEGELARRQKCSGNGKALSELRMLLANRDAQLEEATGAYTNLQRTLADLHASLSWRVTSPLRRANALIRRMVSRVRNLK